MFPVRAPRTSALLLRPREGSPIIPAARHGTAIALALVIFVLGVADVRGATTCSSTCSQTTCTADCTEGDLREAIRLANDCRGNPAWTGRTITLSQSGCTITMQNDAAAAAAHPNSSCAGDPEAYALCLRNDGIHFQGAGATFVYGGTALCGQCADECAPPQPALFTLKGSGSSIEDFTYRYFPEGIHVRQGDGHTIANVRSDRICEDAVTVDTSAGNGHVIRDSRFFGNQPPDPGRTCVLPNGASGRCGTDKAIQLNGGGSTIQNNRLDQMSQPVNAGAGTHLVVDNRTIGSADDQNVCQAYSASRTAVVQFEGNRIDLCKFGIRADGDALVVANDNVIVNPWVSAFDVRGNARLKAAGNRMRTRASGFTDVSSVQRGLVVARNGSGARIDLGGGDAAGRSVVDGGLCAGGGECSIGGNRFCSSGAGVQTDVWNVVDCPCLTLLCGGVPGNCTIGACAPLDPNGSCSGTGGLGASIGARGNCFRTTNGMVAEVISPGDPTTALDGATECSANDCAF